ncbi:hypothetical protein [Treponema putidum]
MPAEESSAAESGFLDFPAAFFETFTTNFFLESALPDSGLVSAVLPLFFC